MEISKRFRLFTVLAVLASSLLTSSAQLDIVGAIDAVQSAKGLPPLSAQQAAAIQAACQAASDLLSLAVCVGTQLSSCPTPPPPTNASPPAGPYVPNMNSTEGNSGEGPDGVPGPTLSTPSGSTTPPTPSPPGVSPGPAPPSGMPYVTINGGTAYTCSNPGTAGYKSTTCASGVYQGLGVFCDPATAFSNGTTGLLIIGQTLRTNCTTDANCASGQACNSYYNPPQCSTLAPKECFAAAVPAPTPANSGICLSTVNTTLPQTSHPFSTLGTQLGSNDIPETDPLIAKQTTGNQPEQLHLAVGTNSTEMYISWITGDAQRTQSGTTPPPPTIIPSVVAYGTAASSLTLSSTGTGKTYSQTYTNAYPFDYNYTSGVIHVVKLTGLAYNTTYFYQVGDGTTTSSLQTFKTGPAVGNSSYPIRFFTLADLGQTLNSSVTVQHMNQTIAGEPQVNSPAFLYHGDFVYADNFISNGTRGSAPIYQTYQPKWDYWGRLIAPLAAQFPWMTTQGNHEIEIQSSTTNTVFASVLARYTMPFKESNSNSPFFYSFNYGPAHVISIAPYVSPNYRQSSAQFQWLYADLASVDRAVTPWVVVQFHNPWYSSYAFSFKQLECFRAVYEPLLYQFGVDIIYNGHVHAYERHYPAYNWLYDQCGAVSITVGDGGNIEGLSSTFVDQPGGCTSLSSGLYYFHDACPTFNFDGNFTGYCPTKQPAISAFREPSFGFGTLDILNSTHAQYKWRRNQDGYSTISDQAYIIRNPTLCPNKNISPRPYTGKQLGWFDNAYNPNGFGAPYNAGLPNNYGSVTQGGSVPSSVSPVDASNPPSYTVR